MPQRVPEQLSKTIETLYRSESVRILATLVHLLGDLDLAEEAMHEAFAAALDTWPQTGIPENPRPGLISTARFKAIDAMRQRARFDAAQRDLALRLEARINEASHEDEEIEDDRLRLIFTCCHPVLPPEGQVALTLREVCGLTTEEIARAFLVTPATLAQRIVRAKAVIRDKAIPYEGKRTAAKKYRTMNAAPVWSKMSAQESGRKEYRCQKFVSRVLAFHWTVSALGSSRA
jgi:RNA polymerase sigma-70 factor, ECF subfamily